MKRKISNVKLSFYIAFAYVGLATIYFFWAMNSGVQVDFLFFIFFPVSIFPFLFSFFFGQSKLFLLFFQTVTFLIIWFVLFFFINLFRDDIDRQEIEKSA
jgi:hypothetical protein